MSKTSFTGFLDKKGVDECEWEEKRVLIQVTGKQAGILHWIAYCHFSEVRWECSCVLWMNKSLSLIGHCLLNSDVTHLTDRHRLENQHKNECRFRFKRKSVKHQHHFQVISTIFSFVQKKYAYWHILNIRYFTNQRFCIIHILYLLLVSFNRAQVKTRMSHLIRVYAVGAPLVTKSLRLVFSFGKRPF